MSQASSNGSWSSSNSLSSGEKYTMIVLILSFMLSFFMFVSNVYSVTISNSKFGLYLVSLILLTHLGNIYTMNHSDDSLAVDGKGMVIISTKVTFVFF